MASPVEQPVTGHPILPPCDWCRIQKAKCYSVNNHPPAEGEEVMCKACERRGQRCNFDYTPRRPGRPKKASAVRRETSKSSSSSAPIIASTGVVDSMSAAAPVIPQSRSAINPNVLRSAGPERTSIFGSAEYPYLELYLPSGNNGSGADDFASSLDAQHGVVNFNPLAAAPAAAAADPFTLDFGGDNDFFADFAPFNASQPQPANNASAPTGSLLWSAEVTDLPSLPIMPPTSSAENPSSRIVLPAPAGGVSDSPGQPRIPSSKEQVPTIESIIPWTDFCFFLSLHLQTQHLLAPVVHKPSFALDILHRRDRTDESFRAMLFSMVTFTICQCPVHTMTTQYPKASLETLIRACQKGSLLIQARQHRRPSVTLLISILLDWLSCQATGRYGRAIVDILMSEARRLVYTLKLHVETPWEGISLIDREICRRLFWVVYTTDKTMALSGSPFLLHDMDGVPPLPLELDDESISEGGIFQPVSGVSPRVSFMTGFNANVNLFRIISQCLALHRSMLTAPSTLPSQMGLPGLSIHDVYDRGAVVKWTDQAMEKVKWLLDNLPETFRNGSGGAGNAPIGGASQVNPAAFSTFGTQTANLHITALSADFVLLDFKSYLVPSSNTEMERQRMAKRAYEVLSSLPLANIAANGESMRGKVLRVILSLLRVSEESNLGTDVWDWWNMYSKVQFLQIMPDLPASAIATRPASPALDDTPQGSNSQIAPTVHGAPG